VTEGGERTWAVLRASNNIIAALKSVFASRLLKYRLIII